jgi:hypothetical protein
VTPGLISQDAARRVLRAWSRTNTCGEHMRWVIDSPGGSGFIYFASGGDLIKIGWSADPARRVRNLRREGARFSLMFMFSASMLDESFLHRGLRSHSMPCIKRSEYYPASSPVGELARLLLAEPAAE